MKKGFLGSTRGVGRKSMNARKMLDSATFPWRGRWTCHPFQEGPSQVRSSAIKSYDFDKTLRSSERRASSKHR